MRNALTKPATQNNQVYGITQPTYLNCIHDGQDPRFYDSPRMLIQNQQISEQNNKGSNNSPLQSPTDTDSVFTDDDTDTVNVTATEKFTKTILQAPPRPPKSMYVAPTSYINLNVQTPSFNTNE